MATIAAPATERNWCVYCPDLILVGEMAITDPELLDPLGDPGAAHQDCAEAKGWIVDGGEVGGLRAAVRQYVREHDEQCESEFVTGPMAHTPCGCAERDGGDG